MTYKILFPDGIRRKCKFSEYFTPSIIWFAFIYNLLSFVIFIKFINVGIRNRPADDFLPQCSRTKYIKANNRTNNSTRTITKHRILQFHSHTIRISPIFFQLFILLLFFITSLRAALQRLSTDEDEIIANTPLGVIRGINQVLINFTGRLGCNE